MSDTKYVSGGAGFPSLLTILFIGLKLTGHVTWSWLWVLSPIWILGSVILTLLTIGLILMLVGK